MAHGTDGVAAGARSSAAAATAQPRIIIAGPWGWLTNGGDDRDRETSVKNPQRVLLGVNIDHVATLRQARGTIYPDPVQAAFLAEEAGADGITVHPREDRRHIQTRDVLVLAKTLSTK